MFLFTFHASTLGKSILFYCDLYPGSCNIVVASVVQAFGPFTGFPSFDVSNNISANDEIPKNIINIFDKCLTTFDATDEEVAKLEYSRGSAVRSVCTNLQF